MDYKTVRINEYGDRLIEVLAIIRDNSNDDIRECLIELPTYIDFDGSISPDVFNWEDDNYSCDCNRELFFKRAGDDDDPELTNCSNGRYSVNLINPLDSSIIYQEFL